MPKNLLQKAFFNLDFENYEQICKNNLQDEFFSEKYLEFLLISNNLKNLKVFLSSFENTPNFYDKGKFFFEFKDLKNALENETNFNESLEANGGGALRKMYEFKSLMKDFTLSYVNSLAYLTLLQSQNALVKGYYIKLFVSYILLNGDKEFFEFRTNYDNKHSSFFALMILQSLNSNGANTLISEFSKKIGQNLRKAYPKTPKIALCLYGVFRGDYQRVLEQIIEKQAKPLNADVFIHSYDKVQVFPSLCGGVSWVQRLLKPKFHALPELMRVNVKLKEHFPRTYTKLFCEYARFISKAEFEDFVKHNESIKSYELERQDHFAVAGCGDKIYYAFDKLCTMAKAYELKHNFEYDYVLILRADLEITHATNLQMLDDMSFNEIKDNFFNLGSGTGIVAGSRAAVFKLCSLYKDSKIGFVIGVDNHLSYAYYAMYQGLFNSLNNAGYKFFADCVVNNALKMPPISEELALDIRDLQNKGFDKELLNACQKGFEDIIKEYGTLNLHEIDEIFSRTSKKLIDFKDTKDKAHFESSLPYVLGCVVTQNSSSLLGLCKMPFLLIKAKKTWQKNKEKRQGSFSQIIAYEAKDPLIYELGEAVIKAYKTWHKGGFVKFFFIQMPKIKKGQKMKNSPQI